jgi:hypothetical protein
MARRDYDKWCCVAYKNAFLDKTTKTRALAETKVSNLLCLLLLTINVNMPSVIQPPLPKTDEKAPPPPPPRQILVSDRAKVDAASMVNLIMVAARATKEQRPVPEPYIWDIKVEQATYSSLPSAYKRMENMKTYIQGTRPFNIVDKDAVGDYIFNLDSDALTEKIGVLLSSIPVSAARG